MSDEIYVPVRATQPTTPANSVHNDCNCIRINVAHYKNFRPCAVAMLNAYPATERPNGIVSIVVTSGRDRIVEAMPRLNRKRLAILQSAMRNELACQTGAAWDLVQEVCAKHGYEVATTTPVPSEAS